MKRAVAMRNLRWLCSLFLFAYQPAQAQAREHFFPHRPLHVSLYSDAGLLLGYGIGNGTGELELRRSDGTRIEYYLAYPQRINGKVYRCAQPPTTTTKRDPVICPSWPSSVVPGKTHVRLTYWWMKFPGTDVYARVSDSMVSDP